MSEDKPSASAATQSAMPESSMEEIIASISRIIEEDNRAPLPSRVPPRDKTAILELTDVVEPDGSVRKLTDRTPPGWDEALGPSSATQAAKTQPAAREAQTGSAPVAEEARAGLASAAASEAAVAAFAQLGTVAGEQRAGPGPVLGAAARTLEDIVRDALRPLLQTWLDDHLPDLVERLVQQEIQRLVREARR